MESNGGIVETVCTILTGDGDDDGPFGGAASVDATIEEIENVEELIVNRPLMNNKPKPKPTVEEILATIPWLMNADTSGDNKRRNTNNQKQRRQLQDAATPVVINSVSFIEIDAQGTVINVFDGISNVEFVTGSSFSLESISSLLSPDVPIEDQLEFVPATAVLFLVGLNSAGEEVLGRFVLRYNNSCSPDAVVVEEGDTLAWNEWSSVEEQPEVFCPANGPVASVVPTSFPTTTTGPSSTNPTVRCS